MIWQAVPHTFAKTSMTQKKKKTGDINKKCWSVMAHETEAFFLQTLTRDPSGVSITHHNSHVLIADNLNYKQNFPKH